MGQSLDFPLSHGGLSQILASGQSVVNLLNSTGVSNFSTGVLKTLWGKLKVCKKIGGKYKES